MPWLGNLNKLGPAAEFPVPPYGDDAQSGQSPFPVAPADKRSYAQNCVVWTKNAGLQVIRNLMVMSNNFTIDNDISPLQVELKVMELATVNSNQKNCPPSRSDGPH